MPTHRTLLPWTLAILASLPIASRLADAQTNDGTGSTEPMVERAEKALDILFLGGTGFIGPFQVEYALARGHRVTLFNRGRSDTEPFDGRVEVLIGNRDATIAPGLAALEGARRWDVVIDNSGYVPRHVRDSVELLKDRCDRYVYVSTVAVYDSSETTDIDETSPLWPAPEPEVEQVTGSTYGPLKAECDRIVQAVLGEKATIVRPTYIVGPNDSTDRFTYWVDRIARGGEVLGPPDPDLELQWVDVRDLCPWIIELAERDQSGVYNASGPTEPMRWKQVLAALTELADEPVTIRTATPAALQATSVRLPLVRQVAKSVHFDGSKAEAAGLRYRPLADTARATLRWWRAQPAERRAAARNWPTAEQEHAALEALRAADAR